ncbi:hypothetical protein ACFLSA_06785 [Bacteroidota bacterium]
MYREITLGPEAGKFYVVKRELSESEEIAVNGVFKIDAAAQLEGKPSMMNPQGGAVSTGHKQSSMSSSAEAMEDEGNNFGSNSKALSGLHLQLSSIGGSLLVIPIYILARMVGKFFGIYTGYKLLHANSKIKKFAAGGLIPQGGIVIGLALLLTREPAFKDKASIIIGIVIGAALIHEIFDPVLSKLSLKKAGEVK